MRSFAEPIQAVVVGGRVGIGGALVRALEERGARIVIATSRSFTEPPRVIGKSDRVCVRFGVDPNQEGQLESLADSIRASEIEPDLVLVTCGVLQDRQGGVAPEKRIEALGAEALLQSFRINTVAPMLALKHLGPLQVRRRRFVAGVLSARVGSIGDNRLGGWYSYRMSKAALNMGVHTAAIELLRRNPKSVCVALHPGTVDTELSRPFQNPKSEHEIFSPDKAAAQLLDVIDGLGEQDNGGFFAWDGSVIPW